ncbi:hypothetical protein ACHAWF_002031, partial [Thalassiosira exigua]
PSPLPVAAGAAPPRLPAPRSSSGWVPRRLSPLAVLVSTSGPALSARSRLPVRPPARNRPVSPAAPSSPSLGLGWPSVVLSGSPSARPSAAIVMSAPSLAAPSSGGKRGIVMVLSPAKTLDLRPLESRDYMHHDPLAAAAKIRVLNASSNDGSSGSGCCDWNRTKVVATEMKSKSESELKKLLGLSASLGKVALEFWRDFSLEKPPDDGTEYADYKPAMFTFGGPAFRGLAPCACDATALSYLSANLYVVDPVYGALRALQDMQPYRLEMGCRPFSKGKEGGGGKGRKKETLATFWRRAVTRHLAKNLHQKERAGGGRILANLASEEYAAAIDPSCLPRDTTYLHVVFRHRGKVVGIHAKRARGLMAKHLAERAAESLEDVAAFDAEGYRCCVGSESGEPCEVLERVGKNVTIARMVFDREGIPGEEEARGKRAGSQGEADGAKRARV